MLSISTVTTLEQNKNKRRVWIHYSKLITNNISILLPYNAYILYETQSEFYLLPEDDITESKYVATWKLDRLFHTWMNKYICAKCTMQLQSKESNILQVVQ
jgi:hypothetical protein